MQVGIYGDSYAASHYLGIGKPWPEMLNDEFNLNSVSYAVNGSSLYYSFTKFKETQHLYEKIVFLVTGVGRIVLPLPIPWSNDPMLEHVNSYESFKFIVDNRYKNSPYLKNVANALEGYYKFIMNADADRLFHTLLVKEIKTIRPDALIIPCIYNIDKEIWPAHETLYNISNIDVVYYNLNTQTAHLSDKRHCHMSQENNYIFASIIADWVSSGSFNFDINKFVAPAAPVKNYFRTESN
jgi:hypothetical protein